MGVLVVISSRVYFLLEKIKIKTKITLLSFIAFKVAFFFFPISLFKMTVINDESFLSIKTRFSLSTF